VVLRALPAGSALAGLPNPSGSSGSNPTTVSDATSGAFSPSDEALSSAPLRQHAHSQRPKSPSPLGEFGKLGSTETVTQARLAAAAAAGGSEGSAHYSVGDEVDRQTQTEQTRQGAAPPKSAWDLFGISAALGSAAGAISGIVGGGLDTPVDEKEQRPE
jgi:hypothetical protein